MNKNLFNLSALFSCAALQLPALAYAEIGMEAAAQTALARVPGVVQSIEREQLRGRAAFEVEIRAQAGGEYEVLIDAEDGSVLQVQLDD